MHGQLPRIYWVGFGGKGGSIMHCSDADLWDEPGGLKESTSSTKFQPAEMNQHLQPHQVLYLSIARYT